MSCQFPTLESSGVLVKKKKKKYRSLGLRPHESVISETEPRNLHPQTILCRLRFPLMLYQHGDTVFWFGWMLNSLPFWFSKNTSICRMCHSFHWCNTDSFLKSCVLSQNRKHQATKTTVSRITCTPYTQMKQCKTGHCLSTVMQRRVLTAWAHYSE